MQSSCRLVSQPRRVELLRRLGKDQPQMCRYNQHVANTCVSTQITNHMDTVPPQCTLSILRQCYTLKLHRMHNNRVCWVVVVPGQGGIVHAMWGSTEKGNYGNNGQICETHCESMWATQPLRQRMWKLNKRFQRYDILVIFAWNWETDQLHWVKRDSTEWTFQKH